MSWILLAGAVLVIGAALSVASRGAGGRAAIGTQAIATLLVWWAIAPVYLTGEALVETWPMARPLGLVTAEVDALSAFFLSWSLPMTLLGTVYASGYLRPHLESGRHGGPHFALLNVVSLSFLIVYSVQNALLFLLGWELAAVAAWLLVIWDYHSQKIRFAGFNYLVSTHVGLFVLVAAFMYLHGETHSMAFATFGEYLSRPSPGRGTVFLLLGASFALKSAFFPLHTWLPRAHAAAPAHVSALMSGVIHKAGLFAFLRFSLLIGEPEEWMGWSVLAFGALSAVMGVVNSASQRDLKRLLGYSSTENVGIAAMGFGMAWLGLTWGYPALVAAGVLGGLLHVLNHAVFKCLLFYAAGSVYRATHTVDVERLGGLLRALPYTGALFGIGALAISGLPPFNGFMSEFVLYSGLLGGHAPTPSARAALVCAAAVLAFVGAVSALSMVRAFGLTFLGSPRDATVKLHGESPASMAIPMWIHAALALLLGLAPFAGIALVSPVVAEFGVSVADQQPLFGVVGSVQVAVRVLAVGIAVACAVGWALGRNARRHVTWGCGYPTPNARMQYTGSGFAEPFVRLFATLLPQQQRSTMTDAIFPPHDAKLETRVADAVEGRLFEVLGRGEELFVRAAAAIPEEPRVAFAAGLVVLVVMVGLLLGGAP